MQSDISLPELFPMSISSSTLVQDLELSMENSPNDMTKCINDPIFSHSTPLSVFNILSDHIDQSDGDQPSSCAGLSPLITPIQSVGVVNDVDCTESGLILQHNNAGPSDDETVCETDVDDSVADPNYQPSDPEHELSPSPLNSIGIINNNSADCVLTSGMENELNNNLSPTLLEENNAASNNDSSLVQSCSIKRHKRKQADKWKKNIRKNLRNSGQEYESSKGKIVQKRTSKNIGQECKCQLKCHNKIDDEGKLKLFTSFWAMNDLVRQRDFLAKNVSSRKTQYSRVVNSRRKFSLTYKLPYNGESHLVCKDFFLKTLDVSEKMIRTAVIKANRGVGEILSPDKRGRHIPGNKDEGRINFANEHIDSFPAVPSHWCRKDTKKIYLESILNREKMYDLYKQHCSDNDQAPLSKTTYKELLIKKNIEFHKPRKDQCWCHRFEQLPEEEKAEKQQEYDIHIRRKKEAMKEKDNDGTKAKEDPTFLCVNFDLEAVLYCPLFFSKPVFYKRKLASFNFTIYEVATKQGHCFFWPEYEGNRGANEVATCIQKFIKSVPPEVTHLVLYSDCCPGQNRNSIVATMFLSTIISPECNIDTIDYKFLESGHTYMECDSMHATIENASETSKICLPNDWENVITLARKNKPYKLNVMDHSDFVDFKQYRVGFLPTILKSTDGTQLQWAKIKWLRFKRSTPSKFFFKEEYSDENFKEVEVKKLSTRGSMRAAESSPSELPPRAYRSQIPISAVKQRDLLELCKSGVIPLAYHDFYKNLPVLKKNSRTVDESDEEADLSLAASKQSYLKRRPRRKN